MICLLTLRLLTLDSMLARSRVALDKLIDEARTLYVNSRSDKIDIFAAGEPYVYSYVHLHSNCAEAYISFQL